MATDLQVADIVRNARLFGEAVDGFLRTLTSQLASGPLVGNAFLQSLKKRVETVLAEKADELASIGFLRASGGVLFEPQTFERALLADAMRVSVVVEDARRQIGGLLAAQQEGMVAMMTSVAHGKPAVQLGTVSAQVHHLEQRRGGLRARAAAANRAFELSLTQAVRLGRHLQTLSGAGK
ncbi:MAG: hypothetical protein FJZ01_18305 [Candidatus Sericytochromatia bacterium]|nr:hypothetical protein [Candidatus Tanganyikabacteria bacterium]